MDPPAKIPLPRDPRHQRFADLVLEGKSLVEAYLGAGYRCARAAAKSNATKLRKRRDVAAYITAIQQRAASDSIMNLVEILEFCARVKRVPITKLRPDDPNDENSDLIKKYKIRRSVDSETESEVELVEVEKLDPFKAIDTHLKLSGDDPEANALAALAEELCALGRGNDPLPKDRL